MAVLGHTYLGIEINATEIHIVEVQGAWPNIRVVRAHQSPTPENVLESGRVVDPVVLGDHLRNMVQTMKPGTRDVVVALPNQAFLARTLDVPLVPPNEMRVILAGELSHYQFLQDNVETFDFLTLSSTSKKPQGGQSVLVMATEERVVSGYNEALERAGLRLIALEPLPIALLRTLSLQLQTHPSALYLLIHHGDIEIAICEQGQLRLYRRLDVSSNDLIRRNGSASAAGHSSRQARTPFGEPDEEEGYTPPAVAEVPLNMSALHSLSLELQRSIEYYNCEFSPQQPIDTILLATPHAELEPLPSRLAATLDLTVLSAALPDSVFPDGDEAPTASGFSNARRWTALGLAMRQMSGLPPASPQLNLSRQRRAPASESTLRRSLGAVMAVSIALIGLGTFLAFRIGVRANHVAHEVSHLKDDIKAMQWDKQNRLDVLEVRSNQMQALSQEGFAFPRYMDAIAEAASPFTGLLEVSLNHTGQFNIQGEATTEQSIIGTLEGLKRSSYLTDTSLISFDSTQSTQSQAHVIKFQITSRLNGFVPPQVASAASGSANGAK